MNKEMQVNSGKLFRKLAIILILKIENDYLHEIFYKGAM